MAQTRQHADLAMESLDVNGGLATAQHLHRHRTVVLQVAGQVHRSHAAGAELPLEAVAVAERLGDCWKRCGVGGNRGHRKNDGMRQDGTANIRRVRRLRPRLLQPQSSAPRRPSGISASN
jgi:hypothetical protein